jgi:signal transduction histidine kinase
MRETHFEDLVKIANGIAHELRNPLVGIGGFVNRIHRTCEAEEQYFRYILLNLRKIETLVEKIQFLVSLPKPQFTEQSVQSLVETACESHAERAREKQVRFVSELEDEAS